VQTKVAFIRALFGVSPSASACAPEKPSTP